MSPGEHSELSEERRAGVRVGDPPTAIRRALRRLSARARRAAQPENRARRRANRTRDAGIDHYRSGDLERAKQALSKAVELNPESSASWLYLARAERDSGELERSLETITAALDHRPGWAPGIWHAAELQAQLGRPEEARRTLAALETLEGQDPEQLLRVGRLATRLEAPELAERIAEHLLEREPENDKASELGALAAWAVDDDPALAIAEQAAARKTQAPLAAAVRLFLRFGHPRRALDLLPMLETLDPALLSATGRSLRQHGYLREALGLLDRAAIDPELVELREQIRGDLRIYDGWSPQAPGRSRIRAVKERVLHVTGSSLPHRISGYTVRTQQVVIAQQRAGLDPHVLTQVGVPDHGEGGEEALQVIEHVDGIPYHRLPHPGAVRLPADQRLRVNVDLAAPAVRKLRPAVLHPASDYHNALIALSLREATEVPVVYEVRGFWEETWLSRQPEGAADSDAYVGRRDTETRCMLEVDHVVTLAEVMKREIVGRGIPPEKVTVVPNAVDTDAFRPCGRDQDLASRLGFGPTETVVGYVGSMVGYEGLDDLVRAVGLLREGGEDVRCLIVGDGRARTDLEILALDLGVAESVLFTGTVPPDEIRRYYGLIDVFALPRRRNRVCELVTPLKPFEAMAMECAVVVSDLDALTEIVAAGETGVVTPPEDPRALAEALGSLTSDPERRRALATTAREWVHVERTWARNAEIYRSVYEAISS